MNTKGKAALKRLREFLNDKPETQVIGVGTVAKILGVTRDRAHKFIRSNPSRLKAELGLGLNPSYEIKVEDLREFIVNDYAIAVPGRPKREVS
jgi:hypothetical protein